MSEACCCVEPDDYYTTLTDKHRKARKDHVCCECGGKIKAGESYHFFAGVCRECDGGVDTFKTCWFCQAVARDFFSCGRILGCMRESFMECNGWDYMNGPTADDLAEDEDPLFEENS